MQLLRAVASVVTCLALLAGSVADCAAWFPTAEGRMLCCEKGPCPGHQSKHQPASPAAHHDHSTSARHEHAAKPADVDRCCTLSAPEQPAPVSTAPATAAAPSVTASASPVGFTVPETRRIRASQLTVPRPPSGIPRHVLLSVFLV